MIDADGEEAVPSGVISHHTPSMRSVRKRPVAVA
jgi:hypothetical protein